MAGLSAAFATRKSVRPPLCHNRDSWDTPNTVLDIEMWGVVYFHTSVTLTLT